MGRTSDKSRISPIYVGYILRQDPAACEIKKLLENREIGKVVTANECGSWLPEWRPGTDYRNGVSAKAKLGGGAALEISHEVDMARYLFGDIDVKYAELQRTSDLEIDADDQSLFIGRNGKNH